MLRVSRVFLRRYSYPPHTILKMPALSPTMTAGNITEWHKSVGDEIQPGDTLVGIETDKAQMDFECQDEGFIAKILVENGAKEVSVNTPIAVIVEEKENVDKFAAFKLENISETAKEAIQEPKKQVVTEPSNAQTVNPSNGDSRKFASPIAKMLAKEGGYDLNNIEGSGPLGRVLKKDVLEFAAKPAVQKPKAEPIQPAQPISQAEYVDKPLSNIRKVIATRLQESKSTIPHYYVTQEIDIGRVLK
jgi:pyruvate dehydrogenase E2 component (dihydrolipoamide acetyltransferase)